MMSIKALTLVHLNERIDDLERNGYRLIQNPEVFCFGIDAVLLAHFAKVTQKNYKILDIGTGTGIIPIIMHASYQKGEYIGIDIQPEMVDMANRSVILNNIEDSVKMLHVDIKNYKEHFKACQFDMITSNPPYMKGEIGLKNEHPSKNLARHEVACTLEDIIEASSTMLKYNGKLCMIHRPLRLVEILTTMKKYNLEPKRLRFVHSKLNKEPNMVLIEAIKNAKPEMRVQSPLIVYKEDGSYTDEIYEIYGKQKKE